MLLLATLSDTDGWTTGPDRVQPMVRAVFRSVTVRAVVAADPMTRGRGLSETPSLCAGCGMIFVYPGPQNLRFIMRDMRYPLDFIWIRGELVIGVTENAPPEGPTPTVVYASPQPADKVLEVNAGFCAAHGIRPGDLVRIVPDTGPPD